MGNSISSKTQRRPSIAVSLRAYTILTPYRGVNTPRTTFFSARLNESDRVRKVIFGAPARVDDRDRTGDLRNHNPAL